MSVFVLVSMMGVWCMLAVSNQVLAVKISPGLIPWFLLSSSFLLYTLTLLYTRLPCMFALIPLSPVAPNQRTLAVVRRGDSDCEEGEALLPSCTATTEGDADLNATTSKLTSLRPPPISTSALACFKQRWGKGDEVDGGDELPTLLLAAFLHVVYQSTSLYVGYWIGSSSTVVLWRSLEPLLVTIIHAKQVSRYEAMHGLMLLLLLGMWDGPTEGEAMRWLMQRGLIVLGSGAWTYRNHLLHTRWRSEKRTDRDFFLRVATYSLCFSLAVWALTLPLVSIERLVPSMGPAFILLTLSMATYIFVGWLLLTQCSLELYSLVVVIKRALFVNGVYLAVMWQQMQAVMILTAVVASSLIDFSKVRSHKFCTLLPILMAGVYGILQASPQLVDSMQGFFLTSAIHTVTPRHIAVISAAGNGNLGDNVQMDAWRSHLDQWTQRTGIPVVLHSWSRELCCSSYDDALKHYLPSDLPSLTRLLRETPRLDWIWVGGGGLLSCPHPPLNDADPAWQYHLVQRATQVGTRIGFMGVGALESELVGMVDPLLQSSSFVGVRDALSVDVVVNSTHLNRSHVSIMHDPVLTMQPMLPPLSATAARVPTCWILQGAWQQNPTISLLVDSFHQPGEDLLFTMEAKDGNFYGRFNPDFVRLHDRDLQAFASSLQHCQFVVSMRFHGSILASVLNIPSLGIDLNNRTTPGKTEALYSSLELDRPDCVLYPERRSNMTFLELKGVYDGCRNKAHGRAHLIKRMAHMRAEFQTQFDSVLSIS